MYYSEEGSLTWLQNVSDLYLVGTFSCDTLRRIPQSGIKKIQHLKYYSRERIDFKSVCQVVFQLSVSKITLYHTNEISSFLLTSVEPCQGLWYISITGIPFPVSHDLDFNFTSSLHNLNGARGQHTRKQVWFGRFLHFPTTANSMVEESKSDSNWIEFRTIVPEKLICIIYKI